MDEAALIRAAQGGDQDAFEQLVRGYDQGVLRLAYRLLRSTEDAYDVYQEAFLRVHRNLHQFRFDCSFSTWLYRIVANLCLDQIRKRKVRKEEPSAMETGTGELNRFDLVYSKTKCCFSGPAQVQHFVKSTSSKGEPLPFYNGEVRVKGTLKVNVTYDAGKVASVYHVAVDSIEPL